MTSSLISQLRQLHRNITTSTVTDILITPDCILINISSYLIYTVLSSSIGLSARSTIHHQHHQTDQCQCKQQDNLETKHLHTPFISSILSIHQSAIRLLLIYQSHHSRVNRQTASSPLHHHYRHHYRFDPCNHNQHPGTSCPSIPAVISYSTEQLLPTPALLPFSPFH